MVGATLKARDPKRCSLRRSAARALKVEKLYGTTKTSRPSVKHTVASSFFFFVLTHEDLTCHSGLSVNFSRHKPTVSLSPFVSRIVSVLADAERNSVIYVFGGSKTSAALSGRRACRQRASFARQTLLFLGRSRHSRRMLPVSSSPPPPKHKHTQTECRHAHTLRTRAKSGLGYSPCVTLDNAFNISGPLCPNSVLAPAEWGAGKSQSCSWVFFFLCV